MSYLLRLRLSDRPGSLGMLAVELGAVGADIRSLEVIERGDGFAIDDIVVELPSTSLPDTLITAAQNVHDVRVESLRPFSDVLDTHQELELIDVVATGGPDRLQVLVDHSPRVLRASWAMVIAKPGMDVLTLFASSGAPETPLEHADWLPLNTAAGFGSDNDWVPDVWRDMDTTLAAAPMGDGSKALLLGRTGGPEFRPSEVARLGYLTGIISTVIDAPSP
ncbi:ACT domain-containing protein [Gordonia sp. MP11Mi]|uniref:Amino acid-binding protein n=1 Tax=Gordonia sp. MP11Mi TaxID=3022769 RepID=A0AA97GV80_9ACTN